MFKKIFESVPVPYRKPEDWAGIPSGVGVGSLYYPYLVEPPRLYAESLHFTMGLFATDEPTAFSHYSIYLLGATKRIYWPSWELLSWRFDGVTGAFIERKPYVGGLHSQAVRQSWDGSLWRESVLGHVFQVNTTTYEEIPNTREEPSKYGAVYLKQPVVDRSRDLIVMRTNLEQNYQIGVYRLSDGGLVRRINVSGMPTVILPEDGTRLFVASSNGMLNLLDYTTGEIISTFRLPFVGGLYYSESFELAWDRKLRRLLMFELVPDAEDGACVSVVSGYYPVPLPVYLTKPIPLTPPRVNRDTSVLTRLVGDAAEPLFGTRVTLGATGDAVLVRQPSASDKHGESIGVVRGTVEGTATVTASVDVKD